MFDNFNWKRYAIRVFIAWAFLAFFLGAASEFKSYAQEEEIWVAIGLTSNDSAFYFLKGSADMNEAGNPTLIMKSVFGDMGTIFVKVEFNCKHKASRVIEVGKSSGNMHKIKDDWMVPIPNSILNDVIKVFCSTGGNQNAKEECG